MRRNCLLPTFPHYIRLHLDYGISGKTDSHCPNPRTSRFTTSTKRDEKPTPGAPFPQVLEDPARSLPRAPHWRDGRLREFTSPVLHHVTSFTAQTDSEDPHQKIDRYTIPYENPKIEHGGFCLARIKTQGHELAVKEEFSDLGSEKSQHNFRHMYRYRESSREQSRKRYERHDTNQYTTKMGSWARVMMNQSSNVLYVLHYTQRNIDR